MNPVANLAPKPAAPPGPVPASGESSPEQSFESALARSEQETSPAAGTAPEPAATAELPAEGLESEAGEESALEDPSVLEALADILKPASPAPAEGATEPQPDADTEAALPLAARDARATERGGEAADTISRGAPGAGAEGGAELPATPAGSTPAAAGEASLAQTARVATPESIANPRAEVAPRESARIDATPVASPDANGRAGADSGTRAGADSQGQSDPRAAELAQPRAEMPSRTGDTEQSAAGREAGIRELRQAAEAGRGASQDRHAADDPPVTERAGEPAAAVPTNAPAPAAQNATAPPVPGLLSPAAAVQTAQTDAAQASTPAGAPHEALPLHTEWLAARGGGSARLVLYPPELGEVRLSVTVRGSAVDIVIEAQEPAALRAASDSRDLLVDALAGRELRVEQLELRGPQRSESTLAGADVDLADRDAQQASEQDEREPGSSSAGRSERTQELRNERLTLAQVPPTPRDVHASGVDLRI